MDKQLPTTFPHCLIVDKELKNNLSNSYYTLINRAGQSYKGISQYNLLTLATNKSSFFVYGY